MVQFECPKYRNPYCLFLSSTLAFFTFSAHFSSPFPCEIDWRKLHFPLRAGAGNTVDVNEILGSRRYFMSDLQKAFDQTKKLSFCVDSIRPSERGNRPEPRAVIVLANNIIFWEHQREQQHLGHFAPDSTRLLLRKRITKALVSWMRIIV